MSFGIRKIQTKLLLAFSLLIVAAVVIGVISFLYQNHINRYHTYKDQLNELRNLSLQAINLEKDYLAVDSRDEAYMRTGESKTLQKFSVVHKKMQNILEDLRKNQVAKELRMQERIDETEVLRLKYLRTFSVLQDKVRQRGFKNYGLEGDMRDAAHQLEKDTLLDKAYVLTLRRHEKDFMLRKDVTYAAELFNIAERLKSKIDEIPNKKVSLARKDRIKNIIDEYQKGFQNILSLEKEIGLDEKKGIRSQLAKASVSMEEEIGQMHNVVTFFIDDLIFQAKLIVISSLIIILITGLTFAIYFSNSIAKPIIMLDRISKSVINGLKNQEEFLDRIQSNDEVGDLAKNFKVMLTKLKGTIAEAEERNLQLEEFTKEEAKRTWATEGLAIFGDILRNNHENLEKQSFEIISTLVKYTNSQQGGIFIVNEEVENEKVMELKGAYAFERRKYLNKTIQYGEGLVGSVWRETDTRLITDIPEGYANITSGLGTGKPSCLLFVPIKNNEIVEGVIELASSKIYEPHEIEFIERLSVRIATTIAAVKANEKNNKLLAASRDFAEKLKAKEFELQKQLQNYETWIHQFEGKLNAVAEEAHIYQNIINRVYEGIILTDEKFIIRKVNNHILKRFGYQRNELEGHSVDVLIETDYANVIDLKERKFKLSYKSFTQNVNGRIIDQEGNQYPVQMMSGKLEIDEKIVYVFLFNEEIKSPTRNTKTQYSDDDSIMAN